MNYNQLDIKYYFDMFHFKYIIQSVLTYSKIYYYTINNNYKIEINEIAFMIDFVNLYNSYLSMRLKEKLYEPFCIIDYKNINKIKIKEM